MLLCAQDGSKIVNGDQLKLVAQLLKVDEKALEVNITHSHIQFFMFCPCLCFSI